jgi:hypothetical protein
MNEAEAILVLFSVLSSEKKRLSIRVVDFYVYLRQALAPDVLHNETARILRDYDPSMIFLALDHLRHSGQLESKGSAFLLTDDGKLAVEKLRKKYPSAVTDDLKQAAKAAA